MQNLVLDPPPGEAGVRRQLDLMVERRILHPQQRKLVRAAEIARFLATGLGRRVQEAARAGRLLREVPFTLGLEAAELYPELAGKVPPGETVLLQGVIDCLVIERDGLVIIDYKTDRIDGERLAEAVDRYRIQLELYARAAGSILGRPVREKYLYFFHLNRAEAL
jgi:ATP-dependent helicase/nuclease subunit A